MCIFVAEASLSARTLLLLSPLSCLSCLSLQVPYSPKAVGVACFGVRPRGSCTSQHSQISKCSSGKSPDPPGERETGKHPAQAGRAQLGKDTLGTRCCLPRGEKVLQSRGWRSQGAPRSVFSQPEHWDSTTCRFVLTRRVAACVQRRGFSSTGAATLRNAFIFPSSFQNLKCTSLHNL